MTIVAIVKHFYLLLLVNEYQIIFEALSNFTQMDRLETVL